jgi:hypothetical protein
VEHADDLNAVVGLAVEDDVFPHGSTSQIGGEFRPRHPGLRHFGKRSAAVFDAVEQSVRGGESQVDSLGFDREMM